MKKSFRSIFVNSTLAFISAFIFTTIFHEFGHYFSYWLFGADPIMYHNYVQVTDKSLGVIPRIITALAGPFFSLLQGMVLSYVYIKTKGNTASRLFMLWLSLLGFVNFFGYLIMTPISTTGDTGKAAELLNLTMLLRITIAVVGLCALIWVILKLGKNFGSFIPNQTDKKSREKYVYSMMFFPVMVGSAINAVLAFPIVAILSVIYPATSPYVIMISFSPILKYVGEYNEKPEFENQIMKSLVMLVLFAVAINRLLTFGIG